MIAQKYPSLILLSIGILLFLSCNSGPQKKDISKRSSTQSEVVEDIAVEDVEEVTVRGSYTTTGPLLAIPIHQTVEITYINNKVIRDVSITNSGGVNMKIIQEYDDKSRLKILRSSRGGKDMVFQRNEYTEDDMLLSEFRIDYGEKPDTTLFEYHYPEDRPNPMHYHRTNNGEKVTEMTLTTKGSQEILEERAFGSPDYIGITTTTRIKNEKGLVLEEHQTSISSDWADKTKIDTTVYEPTYFEYDEKGRLKKQRSNSVIGINGTVESFYSKEGILTKKIIKKNGKRPQTIIFKRV